MESYSRPFHISRRGVEAAPRLALGRAASNETAIERRIAATDKQIDQEERNDE